MANPSSSSSALSGVERIAFIRSRVGMSTGVPLD